MRDGGSLSNLGNLEDQPQGARCLCLSCPLRIPMACSRAPRAGAPARGMKEARSTMWRGGEMDQTREEEASPTI